MNLEPLAVCITYRQFMDALRKRRIGLGLSQMEVDDRAGLQDGYTGKLEVWDRDSGRRLGPVSFDLLLEALGLAVAVVRRPGRASRFRRAEVHPDQLVMAFTDGGMQRHSDADFVRSPGRRRRAHARVLEGTEDAGERSEEAADTDKDHRGGDPSALGTDDAPGLGLREGPAEPR